MKDIHPDYRYTINHEYAAKEGAFFKIGLTDFGQTCFKEITIAHLPKIGEYFNREECCCVLESSKAGNEVEIPLSGTVVAINNLLYEYPSLVNDDYYGKGWLFKMEASDLTEWEELMTAEKYLDEIGFFFRKQR